MRPFGHQPARDPRRRRAHHRHLKRVERHQRHWAGIAAEHLRRAPGQAVVAVAEDANFTRAAERLHVAQPGVSAQIKQLERELGLPLLDRAGRTVTLTEAGTAVLPFARAALGASPPPLRVTLSKNGLPAM